MYTVLTVIYFTITGVTFFVTHIFLKYAQNTINSNVRLLVCTYTFFLVYSICEPTVSFGEHTVNSRYCH